MGYVDGFVAAVPAAHKAQYREYAEKAAAIFMEHGATRVVECWGDDVQDGTVTDFRRSVQAGENEIVVFAWIEYPSREVRDRVQGAMMSDPRMADIGEMPFDGKRMTWGGFTPILDEHRPA